MSRLLIAFPLQESDTQIATNAATRLASSLDAPAVLFTNKPGARLQSLIHETRLSWVDLGLGSRTNRYIYENATVAAWSPWGYKSGPNCDFFRILDWCQDQGVEWVLLAEADLLPVGDGLKARVDGLLSSAKDSWIVGAKPSTESKQLLDPRIHDHINGAAFYRVGSEDFGVFRRNVWIPSLIALIKYFPFFAYDCVTAPGVWDLLNDHLLVSWESQRQRIQGTDMMMNLSNVKVSRDFYADLAASQTKPLFIHAKLVQ